MAGRKGQICQIWSDSNNLMENGDNFILNLTWAGLDHNVRKFLKIAIFKMNTKCFGTDTGEKDNSTIFLNRSKITAELALL